MNELNVFMGTADSCIDNGINIGTGMFDKDSLGGLVVGGAGGFYCGAIVGVGHALFKVATHDFLDIREQRNFVDSLNHLSGLVDADKHTLIKNIVNEYERNTRAQSQSSFDLVVKLGSKSPINEKWDAIKSYVLKSRENNSKRLYMTIYKEIGKVCPAVLDRNESNDSMIEMKPMNSIK